MKNIYLLLIVTGILSLLSGCNRGEDPVYNELSIESTNVELNLTTGDVEKKIKLLTDNGNCKFKYLNAENSALLKLDTSRVEAVLSEKTITFVGKKRGQVIFTLSDWVNNESQIVVNVQEVVDLLLERNQAGARLGGGEITVGIYDGNGGYKIEALNPERATAEIIEPEQQDLTTDPFMMKADIVIKPMEEEGEANFKITDKLGKEATLKVTVSERLVPLKLVDFDSNRVIRAYYGGEPTVIKYEGGNGNFSFTNNQRVNIVMDDETKTMTLTATSGRALTYPVVTDKYGQELKLTVLNDEPFLETKTPRRFWSRTSATFTSITRITEHVASLNRSFIQSGSTIAGVGIDFTGDLEVGAKTNARVYTTARGVENAASSIDLSVCEIVQKEDGYFWFTFTEKVTGDEGYLVIQAQ